jgi:hypothetical protein
MTMSVGDDDLERLAAYYDSTDFSDEIDKATLDTEITVNPMITTSLRLPKYVLDQVRAIAVRAGLRPTQLMRIWIERALDDLEDEGADFGTRPPESHVGRAPDSPTREPEGRLESDSRVILAQLLAALNRSQQEVRDAVHEEMEPMRDWLERREAG